MPLEHGASFAGYTVRRLLGSGGMGDVYLVDHPRLPKLDAMKVLREESSTDDDYRSRFNREAELAASLWHPHIVGLHDRGEYEGRLWITMDYVEGTDAAQLAHDRFPDGMPLDLVTAIVDAVGSALDYAHQRGLLHRDIKPANILIAEGDGSARRIMLSDFGIARHVSDVSGVTANNHAIGTVAYSAPEQLMGGRIDGRADQYALAASAFRLLTGVSPFRDTNPVAVISQHLHAPPPRISGRRADLAPLDQVLMKAMAKEPSERYATCTEFADAFAGRAATVTMRPRPSTSGPPPPPTAGPQTMPWEVSPPPPPPPRALVSNQLAFQPRRKSKVWPAVAAGVALVAVIATAVTIAVWPDHDDAAQARSSTPSAAENVTAWPTPTLMGSPGDYEDVKSYTTANGISGTYQHRGQPGAPTILMPQPTGWRDENGELKPNFAYQMLVYDGVHVGQYPPFAVVVLSKLSGDVDVEALWARAAGEQYNLDGWTPDDAGEVVSLDDYPAFVLSGQWAPDGKPQLSTQYTAIFQWAQGVYLLQLNVYSVPEDRAIRDRMLADINDGIEIFPP